MGVWSLTSKINALVGLEFGEGLVSVPTTVALNVFSCREEEQCPLESRRAGDPRHWRGLRSPFHYSSKATPEGEPSWVSHPSEILPL